MAQVISLLSVGIALAAVHVAVWQVRQSAKNVQKSNALPVLSEIAGDWRSSELRSHRDRLLQGTGVTPPPNGFQGLPPEFRDSAEQWCFFCEGLGLAIAADLVPEDFIISLMGTQIVEVWLALEPLIAKERHYRAHTLSSDIPAEFLPHYEHLVARIIECGGRDAGSRIRKRLGVRRLRRPLVGETPQLY